MNTTATRTARETEPSHALKPRLRVLLVEDDPADRDLILSELNKGEFEIHSDAAVTADEFRQRIRANCPDVVLADYNLGQWRGTDALEIMREEGLDIPLILVSGALGDVTAVECIKQGVTDYVLKDSLGRLPMALRGALKDKSAREERIEARKRAGSEQKKRDQAAKKLQSQIADLETRIAEREQAMRDIEAAMSAPGFYDNRDQAQPVIDRHQALMWELGDLMHQWEELQKSEI